MNPLSVNILERLLKGGINYIPLPHRVGCCCTECSTKQKADGLRLRRRNGFGPTLERTEIRPVLDGSDRQQLKIKIISISIRCESSTWKWSSSYSDRNWSNNEIFSIGIWFPKTVTCRNRISRRISWSRDQLTHGDRTWDISFMTGRDRSNRANIRIFKLM